MSQHLDRFSVPKSSIRTNAGRLELGLPDRPTRVHSGAHFEAMKTRENEEAQDRCAPAHSRSGQLFIQHAGIRNPEFTVPICS
jgi:hypothetical protein